MTVAMTALAREVVTCVLERRTGGFGSVERDFAIAALKYLMADPVEAPTPRAV